MSGLFNKASLVLVPSGYKAGKVYSQVPTDGGGDLTFTRASSATRVNSDGLIEKVRTNLALYSEQFSVLYSAINASITNNTTSAPNGTTTADSLLETTATDVHFVYTDYIQSSGVQYTYSVYIKSISGRNVRISGSSGFTGPAALVDLSNGTLLSGSTGASVASVGGGWYRISLTATTTTTQVRVIIYSMNGTETTFAGSTSNGIYAWGAQLETGSTATEYIPTTNSARTTFAGITQDGTSASNVPRLDYSQGSCPALLLEPQRTNLVTYSEYIDNAIWTKQSGVSVTANQTISPDGTQNADLVVGDGSSGIFQSGKTVSTTVANTKSVYLKGVSGGEVVRLQDPNQTIGFTVCTLTTSWQRFTLSEVQSGGSAGLWVTLIPSGGIYIWGAQLEQGAYATSYIPTTSATVTRLSDVFSRNNIYTNGLITSSGGTWFVELKNNIIYTRDISTFSFFIGDTSSGTTNSILFRNQNTTARLTIARFISGAFGVLYNTTSDNVKLAIKWNGSTLDIFANGVKVVNGSAFTPTIMNFLATTAGTRDVPTFIQAMQLFPTPLSDSDCTQLTTL